MPSMTVIDAMSETPLQLRKPSDRNRDSSGFSEFADLPNGGSAANSFLGAPAGAARR